MEQITPQLNNVAKKLRKSAKVSESTKAKHKKVLDEMASNGGNLGKALEAAGYSKAVIKTPSKVTDTRSWQTLMDEDLPDSEFTKKHRELLNATRIDHMVFPLGPNEEGELEDDETDEEEKAGGDFEHTSLTDDEIKEMLAEVNCKVRRIVHGRTARHVYFWAADNKARKEAIDMGYKLKRRYGTEEGVKAPTGNVYNFIFAPETQARIRTMEDEIKKALITKPNVQETA